MARHTLIAQPDLDQPTQLVGREEHSHYEVACHSSSTSNHKQTLDSVVECIACSCIQQRCRNGEDDFDNKNDKEHRNVTSNEPIFTGVPLEMLDNTFIEMIKASVDKPLPITVYNYKSMTTRCERKMRRAHLNVSRNKHVSVCTLDGKGGIP